MVDEHVFVSNNFSELLMDDMREKLFSSENACEIRLKISSTFSFKS